MKRLFLIPLITLHVLFAGNYTSMGQVKRINNFDLRVTDYGSSLGGSFQWRLAKDLHAGVQSNWTFVSSGKEYTLTDPLTGYTYRMNTINLDFVKAGLFLKKHFFTRQLDNTFAPFVSVQGGPVLAIDTDNSPWANITRYAEADLYLGFYTNFYLGIDFMMEKQGALGVGLGYEINSFTQPVDEDFQKLNWNGAAIVLHYGKYF